MAKTKAEKEQLLSKLDQQLENMKSAIIVQYKGLKVADSSELRKILREKGAEFNVTKNSLVRIALKKHGIEIDEGIFKKPVAIAFAFEDEAAPAKEIALFAKQHEVLEILGGILNKQYLDEETAKRLSLLPTKDELRGRLVGVLTAPLTGLNNIFAGNLRGMINALKQLSVKQ